MACLQTKLSTPNLASSIESIPAPCAEAEWFHFTVQFLVQGRLDHSLRFASGMGGQEVAPDFVWAIQAVLAADCRQRWFVPPPLTPWMGFGLWLSSHTTPDLDLLRTSQPTRERMRASFPAPRLRYE